jgi:putative DNA primase/helicase
VAVPGAIPQGRFQDENPFEFTPEFKMFINTNHLQRASDDTVFASERIKLIPFERHFTEAVQDKSLKKSFRNAKNKSAILNWLARSCRLSLETGFEPPQRVNDAITAYRQEADIIGAFLGLVHCGERGRTAVHVGVVRPLHQLGEGQRLSHNEQQQLRHGASLRLEVRRNGAVGNIVVELVLSFDQKPF